MIWEMHPARDESQFALLKKTTLELYNHSANFRFLTRSMKAFEEELAESWLRGHEEQGIRCFADIDDQENIAGLAVTKSDTLAGFELLTIVVDPERHQKGIGRRLIEHIISVARQDGFKAVDVQVYSENKVMLKLVIDLDFRPIRMTHNFRADGMDVVDLRKYLD